MSEPTTSRLDMNMLRSAKSSATEPRGTGHLLGADVEEPPQMIKGARAFGMAGGILNLAGGIFRMVDDMSIFPSSTFGLCRNNFAMMASFGMSRPRVQARVVFETPPVFNKMRFVTWNIAPPSMSFA